MRSHIVRDSSAIAGTGSLDPIQNTRGFGQ